MENRIHSLEKFRCTSSNYTVESFICWIKGNALDFDAPYQRDYVWGKEEQQAFLQTLCSGFPLGSVAIAKHKDWLRTEGPWLEVVDGKQRLTTIKKFIMNEIPLILQGENIYWKDLTRPEQLRFGSNSLPSISLDNATDKEILDYFIAVNFTGVPQSSEHKDKVLFMRSCLDKKD